MNASLLIIDGNHLTKLNQIFERFGYYVGNNNITVNNWQGVLTTLAKNNFNQSNKPNLLRLACYYAGRTFLFEPDSLALDNIAVCNQLSIELESNVFIIACQSETESYTFKTIYNQKTLSFNLESSKHIKNFTKTPLTPANKLEHLISFVDKELGLLSKFGLDCSQLKYIKQFVIKKVNTVCIK